MVSELAWWRRGDPAQAAGGALLFASGVAAEFAWRGGLYANVVLAGLVGLRLGVLLLRPALQPAVSPAAPQAGDTVELQAELRRLRFMLDQMPAPLLTLSATGALEASNRAARALFGTDGRITDAPAALLDAIGAAPERRTLLKLASRSVAHQPETDRSYALSVAAWSSAHGPALLAVLVDIQAELQAVEAAALRELLQTLGHEIMNALTPVTSLAEMARSLLTTDQPEVADALETIARRASGLDRFVQGYRTLARVPPALRRMTSIGRILDEAALLFRSRWQAAGVSLTLHRPSPDIRAVVDADLLGQALTALLTNAAEAALAMRERKPVVTLSADYVSPYLRLLVTDSGPGVAPLQRGLIFQPLFTTKPAGTGIGLGVARQIALGHGGTLVLQDTPPDQGATFCLMI